MKKAVKILLPICVICLCFSLIAGATFALFTSESKVDIAVSSGKVEVTASISGVTTYSYTEQSDGTFAQSEMAPNSFIYGTAVITDGQKLTLDNIVPGDKAEVALKITNLSTVAVKYQVIIDFAEDENFLNALSVSGFGDDFVSGGLSAAKTSKWQTLEVGSGDIDGVITIELPYDYNDDSAQSGSIQGKTCSMTVTVKAVQGNAQVSDPIAADPDEPSKLYVNNLSDLQALSKKVNAGDDFAAATVYVYNDIDLSAEQWTPIGTAEHPFAGSFVGANINGDVITKQSKSITFAFTNPVSGIKYGGLFGYLCGSNDPDQPQEISYLDVNVNIVDNADDSRMGGIAGKAYGNVVIDNVTVSGSISSNKIASGFIGDVRHDGDDLSRSSNLVVIKNCTNLANICAPKGVGFAANVNGVDLTLENCTNGNPEQTCGNITAPEGTTADIVMGGFTGYIQQADRIINFTNCINYGNITIDITAHISKLSVGGISGGGRGVHTYVDVYNYGNITINDREEYAAAMVVGEIGGLIGSASAPKHLKHVENHGDIMVTTINSRDYGVGGLFGEGSNNTIQVTDNDGKRSVVDCVISVVCTTDAQPKSYRVAGAVTGYKANAATSIENTDITVTLTPYIELNYGLTGNGSEFMHTDSVYANIKNVTYTVSQPTESGEVGLTKVLTWDAEGNLDMHSEISSVEGFKHFAQLVNGGQSFAGETIILTDDIDFSGEEFRGVGDSNHAFRGTFDGNSKSILNLVVTGDYRDVGLFLSVSGTAEQPAIIKNLVISGIKTSTKLENTSGGIGAVVGEARYTNIENVQVKDLVFDGVTCGLRATGIGGILGIGYQGTNILNCSVESKQYIKSGISDSGYGASFFGGIVGHIGENNADSLIKGCHVKILVNANSMSFVGGIAAVQCFGTRIENCYVEMDVANADAPVNFGGITGYTASTITGKTAIENCYVKLSVDGHFNRQAGELYGVDDDTRCGLGGILARGCKIEIKNCFVDGDISGGRYIIANCTGDINTDEVPTITGCSWSAAVESHDYWGYQTLAADGTVSRAPSCYGQIYKESCSFSAGMTYDQFVAELSKLG